MLKLTTNTQQSIPASQMKGGDIAVITGWVHNMYVGRIVQRYKQHLITIGAESYYSWPDYFNNPICFSSCRVRILELGEMLIVTQDAP